ncbi:hypothetical protein DBR11_17585 [Pedobacter sp. HMWF019]|nr:hypothetical protein DBR11_17585 [Pedobacter sp. HMWF019]
MPMNRFLKSYVNLYRYKGLIFITAIHLFCISNVIAQSNYKLTGIVRDSLNHPVPDAGIQIITGTDTLKGTADYRGKFTVIGIVTSEIYLTINAMGYLPFSRKYTFSPEQRNIAIQAIMEKDVNTLKEVVIKAKVIPIRLMKDTVEYNAAAYTVRETDRVEDLLRQLPGINVDNDGKVTAMGRSMTKLRVNGEDFFTNNVKDFIAQLPADMVAKVQVINDYGDEANFTGVKTGASEKMLNLVTKPGRNKGNFGNTAVNGGTNDRYGLQTNANLWREKKQIGVKGNIISTNNSAGVNRTISTGANYRDKLSPDLTASVSYSFDNVRNQTHQLDFVQTLNSLGTIFTTNDNERTVKSSKHNLNWNIQSVKEKSYLQAGIIGTFLNTNNQYMGGSNQTGIIRQDQFNNTLTKEYTPDFNANIAWAYRFDKPGRNLSLGITAKNGTSDLSENLDSRTGYYEPGQQTVAKDSVLNRLVDTRNRSQNIGGSFRFSEPIGSSQNASSSRNVDIYYNFQMETNDNNLLTRINNHTVNGRIVDSLSTKYTSKFISHLIGVSYRFGSDDLTYSLGMTAQPNLLIVDNEQPVSQIHHAGFNLAPVVNLSLILSQKTSITFLYNGSSVAPNLAQLQPVPNTRNLQNIVIGNPNLRSTFNHNSSLTYQNSNPINGRALMLGINSNFVQDQVVSNVILKPDTLNSLKQETHFENANGTYGIDALYSWSKPFVENKFNVEFRGSVGFANNVSYTDNILNNNRGFNFSQAAMLRMNQKGITLSTDANYTYSSNRYSLPTGVLKDIQIYEFNVNLKTFITPTISIGLDGSKRVNIGYAVDAKNPLIINTSIQKTFFKKQQATLKLQAYDLFNQGNSLIRSVVDNSITDSRNTQITRYLQLSFSINLQQFGG